MWSQDDEAGALAENSSSRERLLGDGSQKSPAVLIMQKTAEQDRGVKSPNAELTFVLEEEHGRNVVHNFAATAGPTLGGKNILKMEQRGEQAAAKAASF